MHGPDGLGIRDRRRGLKFHRQSWIVQEAVDWMVKHYGLTPSEAVRLSQRLVDRKLIYSLKCGAAFMPPN
ncbi:MAG: hypothetical protein HC824_03830 [Synechococcales cyanobacterium RM1_1_8]|nr:hypothetical protein [Synechococcales cyanobacterium RM1_1_8]